METIGEITVGFGTPQERKIRIENVIQFSFIDHRLISISQLVEDNGFIVIVENPASTGRDTQSKIWLSKESFKAVIHCLSIYHQSKGWSIEEDLKELFDKDQMDYCARGNITCIFDKNDIAE